MRILPILAVFLCIFSFGAFAAGNVGDTLPGGLALPDYTGEVQSYDSVKGEKGTVVVFVRSVEWCPFCQVQLLDLRDNGGQITDLGYNIVTVSYDKPDALKNFKSKYGFSYMMLSDEDSATIKALGILNEDYEPDHFAYGVPKPTVYIVGDDGVIHDVLAEEGYKKRPQIDVILGSIGAPR